MMTEGPVAKDIDLSTGLHMHYFEWHGSGPVLIFLHPSSGYGRMWEFTVSHLLPGFHVYAPDQRGHGDSEGPDGGYTGEEYAQDLRAFMKAQGIERAILAGHSLGGRVAQIFASKNPEMTQALILVGGPHYESFFQEASIVDSVLQGAEKMRSSPVEFDTEEDAVHYNRERYPFVPEEAIRHRVQYGFRRLPNGKYGPRYDPLRVAQGLAHIPDDLTGYAREISCPVAFVLGGRAPESARAGIDKVAACYEKTSVQFYEADAVRVLQAEDPAGLAKAIREFIGSCTIQ
jgi:2-(acetamidomethylene)succinate hydrolase